jgi:hypothetical protein
VQKQHLKTFESQKLNNIYRIWRRFGQIMIYFGKKWDILVKGGGVLVKVGGIFGRVRFGSEGVLTCIPSQVHNYCYTCEKVMYKAVSQYGYK